MATTDIPEFVEFSPGDPIRSEDWNNIQRQIRNVVRGHRHTRLASTPANDASSEDAAVQIATDDIADLAVTAAKLAAGSVTAAKLADGAITNPKLGDNAVSTTKLQDAAVIGSKLAPNAVARANIQDAAINRPKLAIQDVATANVSVPVNSVVITPVKTAVPQAQTQFLFPMLTITSTSGSTLGGFAHIEPTMVYRRALGASGDTVDVFLRLLNNGTLGANVTWRVVTFAP